MLARCEERGWVPLKCNCVSYLASEDRSRWYAFRKGCHLGGPILSKMTSVWSLGVKLDEWGVLGGKERLQGVQRGQEGRLWGSGTHWGQGRRFRGPRGSKGSSWETRGTPRGLRGPWGRFRGPRGSRGSKGQEEVVGMQGGQGDSHREPKGQRGPTWGPMGSTMMDGF